LIRAAKIAAVIIAAFFIAPYVVPSPRVEIPADLLAASDQVEPRPVYRFTSDGCSGGLSIGWRAVFGAPPPFEGCCVGHDFWYWRGGTVEQRASADEGLWRCVAATGHPWLAWVMWAGVQPGGSPKLPFPWRWGYGEYYYRPYASN
jgi:hypothetical protein